jgi:hypothetical protein
MRLNFARLLVPSGCAILLGGCIAVPLPHYTRSSPNVSGRVIDAKTGAPIEGARVEWVRQEGGARRYAWGGGDRHPGPVTMTGTDGRFGGGTRLNLHLFWYANVSFQFHWPTGSYWHGDLEVTREGYASQHVQVVEHWNGEYSVRASDIRLVEE